MVNIISYTTCHPALDCSVSDRHASPMSKTSCYADLVSASRKPRRCVLRMLVTPVLPEGRELVQQLSRNVAVSMDLSTQTLQRLLYTLSFRLELTTATPCWLGHQGPSQTGFNVCLMRQPEWSVVHASLIAACPNCFTPSYIGWTFLSVSSINSES